jgi:hypothetical protein
MGLDEGANYRSKNTNAAFNLLKDRHQLFKNSGQFRFSLFGSL